MASSDELFGVDSLSLVESFYEDYLRDPQSVDAQWRTYFARMGQSVSKPVGGGSTIAVTAAQLDETVARQERVDHLVRAYRVQGHSIAQVDPLGRRPVSHPELELAYHGLSEADLDMPVSSRTMKGVKKPSLRHLIEHLKNTYCRSIGVQYMHIDSLEVKDWLQERMESVENRISLSVEEQRHILAKLTAAEMFEQFVHKKFLGAKRFSLEGGESLIPLLDMAIEEAARYETNEVVIGMPHRGRLNVLVNILGKDPRRVFEEFADEGDPRLKLGGGDVKYHMGYSSDRTTRVGTQVHMSLCFNPSHLEFVGPVVNGRVRAKQDRVGDVQRKKVLGVVMHGDAAFIGQGVVQEMLNMGGLPGYGTGGTLHIVVNNQIGFTTPPESSRSSAYATDIAKMLDVPIFHVNGEDPEGVAQVITLAMAFRERFARDVVIDMYCFRKYGHNEGDEPTFTQPVMYQWIQKRPSVREMYTDNLVKMGGITRAEADDVVLKCQASLEEELNRAKRREGAGETPVGQLWQPYCGGLDSDVPDADTGVSEEVLGGLLQAQTQVPEGFAVHPKMVRFFEQRREAALGKRALDWGAAESLAFASLLREGVRVRLSGQDCGRGTFSHRHAVLHDYNTGACHVPLNALGGASFEVLDSPLSETGVLGFDYGYSLDAPDALVIWEAQFGDFANGAQVIIDQFISSSEDKWKRLSGLVMLLPHGFEGQGPEHSSARLERFLNLAAEDNMQVVYPTTPAQIFHVLRRQVHRRIRKPLVVMSPKSLLRHPLAVSSLKECAVGGFQRVLGDVSADPSKVRRVLLCSGKVYYDLTERREKDARNDVAVVRLEQLYPLRHADIAAALDKYSPDVEVLWVQEEPRNMGAWPFMAAHFEGRLLGRWPMRVVARAESASPATGSLSTHKYEHQLLMDEAFLS
jgi:2-oxoglutarate dehydrogenase E1 component